MLTKELKHGAYTHKKPTTFFTLTVIIQKQLIDLCYRHQSGSARGGSGITVYPKKIRQNTQKYPKFIQIYPKLYPGILYTLNSKKVIYRIPIFKLQYNVYPI